MEVSPRIMQIADKLTHLNDVINKFIDKVSVYGNIEIESMKLNFDFNIENMKIYLIIIIKPPASYNKILSFIKAFQPVSWSILSYNETDIDNDIKDKLEMKITMANI